jgi:hypothetical protein
MKQYGFFSRSLETLIKRDYMETQILSEASAEGPAGPPGTFTEFLTL